jgi:hypothetical protein
MIAGSHPNVTLLSDDCVLLGGMTSDAREILGLDSSRVAFILLRYTGTGNGLIVSVTITHL